MEIFTAHHNLTEKLSQQKLTSNLSLSVKIEIPHKMFSLQRTRHYSCLDSTSTGTWQRQPADNA